MHAFFSSSSVGELCRRARDLESEFGLSLNRDQIRRLGSYLDVLLKWQERVNLISEPSAERLLRLHFLESFWLAENFLSDQSALTDLGTGAGFPGLAAKLYRPLLSVTLVEKNTKKALFLEEVTRRLKLRGVSIFPHRWQEYEALADGWNRFDSGTESLAGAPWTVGRTTPTCSSTTHKEFAPEME